MSNFKENNRSAHDNLNDFFKKFSMPENQPEIRESLTRYFDESPTNSSEKSLFEKLPQQLKSYRRRHRENLLFYRLMNDLVSAQKNKSLPQSIDVTSDFKKIKAQIQNLQGQEILNQLAEQKRRFENNQAGPHFKQVMERLQGVASKKLNATDPRKAKEWMQRSQSMKDTTQAKFFLRLSEKGFDSAWALKKYQETSVGSEKGMGLEATAMAKNAGNSPMSGKSAPKPLPRKNKSALHSVPPAPISQMIDSQTHVDISKIKTQETKSPKVKVSDSNTVRFKSRNVKNSEKYLEQNPIEIFGNHYKNVHQKSISNAGKLIQIYGYFALLKQLQWYFRQDTFDSLSKEEKSQFLQERTLTIAALSSSTLVDVGQFGLSKLNENLMLKLPHELTPSTWNNSNNILKYTNQIKWLNRGMAGLNLVSVGLDAYLAYEAFLKASRTQDKELWQDLIVSGALSSVSAASTVGTTMLIALGGTAVLPVVVPATLVLAVVMLGAGKIYESVRAVDELQKYVTLDGWQKFEVGLKNFFGMRQSGDWVNPMIRAKTKEAAQEKYIQDLLQNDKRKIRYQKGVKSYYRTKNEVILDDGQFYKVVKGYNSPMMMSSGPLMSDLIIANPFEGEIIADNIADPLEAERILKKYQDESHAGVKKRYSKLQIENSEHKFYTPTGQYEEKRKMIWVSFLKCNLQAINNQSASSL